MPLLKRKAYSTTPLPADLSSKEEVWVIRFTGEAFREYSDYLKQLSLYRQRVWTCKFTGKTSLTYEEALVTELSAAERIQQFPETHVRPVLLLIQYSTLKLEELADTINKRFREEYVPGEEVGCLRQEDNQIYRCRILEQLSEDQYHIGWIANDNEDDYVHYSEEHKEALSRKKPPLSRALVKNYVREVAALAGNYKGAPWIVHEKYSTQYSIEVEMPEEMSQRYEEYKVRVAKREEAARIAALPEDQRPQKQKAERVPKPPAIKYPIEDLTVEACPGDPDFSLWPQPFDDFMLPRENVPDLLMVFDFLSRFGKCLKLSPFSLDDLERAVLHEEGPVALLVEVHTCLLSALVEDLEADRVRAAEKDPDAPPEAKRHKTQTVQRSRWAEGLRNYIVSAGEKGAVLAEQYGMLQDGQEGYPAYGVQEKLHLLKSLCDAASSVRVIHDLLDEQYEAILEEKSRRREELMEERRADREEAERLREEQQEAGQEGAEPGEGEEGLAQPEGEQESGEGVEMDVDGEGDGEEDDEERRQVNGASTSLGKGADARALTSSRQMVLKAAQEERAREEAERQARQEEEERQREEKREVDRQAKIAQKKKDEEETRRARNKEVHEKEMERLAIRVTPLGLDRHHNKYWFFPMEGRIFLEDSESTYRGYWSAKEQVDLLLQCLNPKGTRERALLKALNNNYVRITTSLVKRSKEIANAIAADEANVRRSSRNQNAKAGQQRYLTYVNKIQNPGVV